jgi:L-rhamnose mutarotase
MTMTAPPVPRRFGQIIRLRPSSLSAYKALHAAAWPAVLRQIKDCHISDYSIYLDEASMTLFATLKYDGDDWEADMAAMRANPEVRRWWELTDAMQETLVEGSTGSVDAKGWWRDLEEIFRVD